MILKNKDLQSLAIGLNALSKLKSKENTFKIAYNCAKSLRLMEGAITDYDTTRTAIIENYAKVDEQGNIIKTPTENGFNYQFDNDVISKVDKELNELLNAEIEIPLLVISKDEIESSKLEGITGEILFNLGNFITE